MATKVDPRIAHTRQVVLAAAVEELTEVGFERISIDAIAERSGVARSTIYRNWTDRATLLAEAFRQICAAGPADLHSTGSLTGDLRSLGQMLTVQLRSDDWDRTVPSLISSATHDESMGELLADFSAERAAQTEIILARATERGSPIDAASFTKVMERFVAPFFFRRLISRLPLDDGFVDSQVQAALNELGLDE